MNCGGTGTPPDAYTVTDSAPPALGVNDSVCGAAPLNVTTLTPPAQLPASDAVSVTVPVYGPDGVTVYTTACAAGATVASGAIDSVVPATATVSTAGDATPPVGVAMTDSVPACDGVKVALCGAADVNVSFPRPPADGDHAPVSEASSHTAPEKLVFGVPTYATGDPAVVARVAGATESVTASTATERGCTSTGDPVADSVASSVPATAGVK